MNPSSLTLLIDLYELTMAYGYWKLGMIDRQAVFTLFFRNPPFQGNFAIVAGLQSAIDFIKNFKFDPSDIHYLQALQTHNGAPLFEKKFINYLQNFTFACDVDGVEEGTLIFPYEPLIRVQGPIIQAQLLESALLNIINFQTLIATKASRICMAAEGDEVIEFGLRRAQGVDGAFSGTRAAFIGGCHATSNVLAGKHFGIPVQGTHAHSWVMAFENEKEAFTAYARVMPNHCTFVLDTYDTMQGIKKAIEIAKNQKGLKMMGVRIDSGDLAHLSIHIRKLLDNAGYRDTQIIASNELDEMIIHNLKNQGAKIDVWGVGTALITGKGQAALDGVYKLSAIQDANNRWRYKLKTSEQFMKTTNPGILQVRRFFDTQGMATCDMIYDIEMKHAKHVDLINSIDPSKKKQVQSNANHKDLLVPIFRSGKQVYEPPTLLKIQTYAQLQLNRFFTSTHHFLNPQPYFIGLEKTLYDLKMLLIQSIRSIER